MEKKDPDPNLLRHIDFALIILEVMQANHQVNLSASLCVHKNK